MKNIAIFASGTGSNARKIIEYFQDRPDIAVALLISNKASAAVLPMASSFGIKTLVIDRTGFYHSQDLLEILREYEIDLIVLAGFLWLVPPYLVANYRRRIINIHPALLPKYGGKGMYNHFVHEAVHAAGEKQSGITIHYVNEQYDEGDIIFQATCELEPGDKPDTIAGKVLQLEHTNFPKVIDALLSKTEMPETALFKAKY